MPLRETDRDWALLSGSPDSLAAGFPRQTGEVGEGIGPTRGHHQLPRDLRSGGRS